MSQRVPILGQTVTVLLASIFMIGLTPGFDVVLTAQTVDPRSVLGDTAMPPPNDISQVYPYGITGKTPPSLIKVNDEGQKPYHKHRIQLRIFQGCPQIEISEGGRLWATWFGSNIQAERAPFHKDQFSVIATSGDPAGTLITEEQGQWP